MSSACMVLHPGTAPRGGLLRRAKRGPRAAAAPPAGQAGPATDAGSLDPVEVGLDVDATIANARRARSQALAALARRLFGLLRRGLAHARRHGDPWRGAFGTLVHLDDHQLADIGAPAWLRAAAAARARREADAFKASHHLHL